MELRGEVRSAKISRKVEDDGRQSTTVDLRIKIVGVAPALQIINLAGENAILNIEKAQLTLDESKGK